MHNERAVTNGVHFASWMSSYLIEAVGAQLGPEWVDCVDQPGFWESIQHVDDAVLWDVHRELKRALIGALRDHARGRWARHGTAARHLGSSGMLFDEAALTIGFVRHFTSYKRTPLLFRDLDRLEKLVNDKRTPLQIVFAGQPHPADDLVRQPRFRGRIAFVPAAARVITRRLVQGVDLWLSVPRAHDAVEITAALNAVPEVTLRDDDWADGAGAPNGWMIPDTEDASALYDILERIVVPTFYARDARDVPTGWARKMKHALRLADPRVTARRMALQYVSRRYAPRPVAATRRVADELLPA